MMHDIIKIKSHIIKIKSHFSQSEEAEICGILPKVEGNPLHIMLLL